MSILYTINFILSIDSLVKSELYAHIGNFLACVNNSVGSVVGVLMPVKSYTEEHPILLR